MTADQWIALVAGIVGGALRVGAPFLFVSLGECLTEKSGRINLGLEGVLVLSAMAAFGGAYLTDSAWLGVLIGAVAGALLALLHGLLCSLDRVNDVATGIALMLLGTGLAFVLILASEGLRMIDWKTLLKNRMPRAVQPTMTKETTV